MQLMKSSQVKDNTNLVQKNGQMKGSDKMQELSKYSTKELVEELSKRTGVEKIITEPYQDKVISINGPAIVLKIID